ncbi:MAG: efflux RND transporter periplasmic adaptor subunit, partial [Muribaculaceae bacterium]|nr:efflux RND transporter periplasmic adaptor subunit [Muribaculaceae bacterium]
MDTEIKKRFPRLRKYGLPALLAVVLISAGTGAWLSTRVSTYHTDFNKLVTDKVFAGEFNDYINLTGKVETDVIVKVSPSETGIVESISVEEGAMVHEGDIILTLRNPLLRQQILDSESQLAEKQNMLRDTEITMEKERLQVRRDILSAKTEVSRKRRAAEQQKTLFEEGLTSREEYLKAREEYDLARENLRLLEDRLHQDSIYRTVQVAMMKENLRNMEENFQLVCQRGDNLNVRASHTGQLGSLNADIGQTIS